MKGIGAATVAARGTLAGLGIIFILVRMPISAAIGVSVVLVFQVAAAVVSRFYPARPDLNPQGLLLGATLVLLPTIHPEALLAPLLLYLLLDQGLNRQVRKLPAIAVLVVVSGWLFAELWNTRDPLLAVRLLKGDFGSGLSGLGALHAWVRTGMPPWVRQFEWILRIFACAALSSSLSARRDHLCAVIRGVGVGLVLSIFIAGAEIWVRESGRALTGLVPNQTEYWDSIRRISGSFSDPNAFGVAVLLCVPLLLAIPERSLRLRFDSAMPWICAAAMVTALFSGSRSYVLGVFVLAFLVVAWSRPVVAALATAVLAAGVVALNLNASLQAVVASSVLPQSLNRALESLIVSNASGALFSRALFWRIGGEVFRTAPWLGVGPGKFREFVTPLTYAVPGVPALWTDNANNMYVEVLVELGLLGFAVILLSLAGIRFRAGAPLVVKAGCLTLLIVLFFGPHLEFNEVAALSAILLAAGCEFRPDMRRRLAVVSAVMMLPFIVLKASSGQFGFSGWERDAARYFRWTGTRAQGFVRCEPGAALTVLYLRGARPRNHPPLVVEVQPVGSGSQAVTLESDEISAVNLPCPGAPTVVQAGYRLIVSRPWSPRSPSSAAGDGRLLGVQVVTRDPASTLPF